MILFRLFTKLDFFQIPECTSRVKLAVCFSLTLIGRAWKEKCKQNLLVTRIAETVVQQACGTAETSL